MLRGGEQRPASLRDVSSDETPPYPGHLCSLGSLLSPPAPSWASVPEAPLLACSPLSRTRGTLAPRLHTDEELDLCTPSTHSLNNSSP